MGGGEINMCSFCDRKRSINTSIGDFPLKLSFDEDNNNFLKIRIEQGSLGITRPIRINYCPFCGEKIIKEEY